jgi:hypothetical protein
MTFQCWKCSMSYPLKFRALTYAYGSNLCRWCAIPIEGGEIPKPVIIFEPDKTALTLAEVVSMIQGGLDAIRRRQPRWSCW